MNNLTTKSVCGSSSMKIFILLISLLFANASNETTGTCVSIYFGLSKVIIVSACNDGKIRGVNAGGWLLLEPWITPKFFESLDIADGNQVHLKHDQSSPLNV